MAQIQPWSLRELSGLLDAPTRFSTNEKDIHEDQVPPPHILVRDPPRDQLPVERSQFCEDLPFFTRFPGKSSTLAPAFYITPLDLYSGYSERLCVVSKSTHRTQVGMAKKRRSLQSLFIPSFLTAPPSPTEPTAAHHNVTRMRSQSAADETLYPYTSRSSRVAASESSAEDSPPPDYLLDEDPFANLSAPSASSRSATLPLVPATPLPPQPRSPLTPNTPESKPSFLASPPRTITPLSSPEVSRALSGRVRPAYQKPAFTPRPSLPSLDTLARMNVVLTKKVRKGRVGAGLPFEPWDNLGSSSTASTSQESIAMPHPASSGLAVSQPTDLVADLELDFLDFSDEEKLESPHVAGPSSFSNLRRASPTQPDLSFSADSETSFDELGGPLFSRTASELSTLTRSTSLSSTSSIESPHGHQWPSFSSYNVSSSSTEDSDALSSPPDDYFTFPSSRYSSNIMGDSYWSSDFMYDTFDSDHTSHNALFSDVDYLGEFPTTYEPGTSAGTIRPSMEAKAIPADLKAISISSASASDVQVDDNEAVDGAGRDGHQSQHGGFSRSLEQGKGGSSGGVNGSTGGSNGQATGRNGLSRREDDEDEDKDEDKKRTNRSTFSTSSDSDASTSESEDSMDEHSVPTDADASRSALTSDDDVPLARRIPTALRAQRTIRRQVREEREQRRAARTLRQAESASTTSRQPVLRPPGAADPLQSAPMSSSQEAALHASKSYRRPRTKTLPASEMQPFNPEDLTRKLQTMEVAQQSVSQHHQSNSGNPPRRERSSSSRPGSAGRDASDSKVFQPFASRPHSPQEGSRGLRLMRSFHQSDRKVDDHRSMPLPSDGGFKISRSLTRSRPREDASTSNVVSPRSYTGQGPYDESFAKLHPRRSGDEARKITKQDTKLSSTSIELERSPRSHLQQRPPVPPLPVDGLSGSSHTSRGTAAQQRIFVGDMQRFNMVEIGPSTNAGDVIEMVEAQGTLKGLGGSGQWMVWEVAQDFGMERPIRNFELLADVQASWNKDKMVNTFIIKLTPLAGPLSRSAMPTVSPTHSGYVEWESKRGKWNKRWLQLREHSLWLSKRDNGRDEVLLCSLSSFDAYFITRPYKAPRPFSFAIKSTDNLSFFENTADYLHIFSCLEKEGAAWMEAILLARSYVLFQERNVLFNPRATIGVAVNSATSLSRAGTRKTSSARPPQPLLAVSPPFTGNTQHTAHSNDVFEPGSLLRKLA